MIYAAPIESDTRCPWRAQMLLATSHSATAAGCVARLVATDGLMALDVGSLGTLILALQQGWIAERWRPR